MKRSLICLVVLATPLAACIVRPSEDCPSCSDPSCPTSTSYSPPPSTYSSPPPAPTDHRDAGADLPPPPNEADAGTAVARPDSGVASPSDSGNLADLVAPSSCTDAGTCGKPVVPLCTWNHECGNGGRCADAECQRPCTSNSVCGTGHTCQAGFCACAATVAASEPKRR